MAGTIQTAPDTTPGGVADWESELNLRELSMRGYDGVSLTEWEAANTDKPSVAAGSVIEINGALAKYAVEEALTDEGGLSDGWCYIKHMVSGTNVTPTLTNTFGTWDAAKHGFYDGLGNRFSLFAMYRSGAVTKIFSYKSLISNNGILIQTPLQTDINGQGHIEYTSSVYSGEKIKYKVIDGSCSAGDTNVDVAHGISNAYTNNRILSISAISTPPTPLFNFGLIGDDTTSSAFYRYYYTDINVRLTRGATSVSNLPFRMTIIYV